MLMQRIATRHRGVVIGRMSLCRMERSRVVVVQVAHSFATGRAGVETLRPVGKRYNPPTRLLSLFSSLISRLQGAAHGCQGTGPPHRRKVRQGRVSAGRVSAEDRV